MLVKSSINSLSLDLSNMKTYQPNLLSSHSLEQCAHLGTLLARLRLARKIKQTDAAIRSGLSRNTVYRLEKGDPGVALGQVLRYLEAISPGSTMLDLLSEKDPSLVSLSAQEKTQRVRDLTAAELRELDF